MLLLCALAAPIGVIGALVAKALLWLIAIVTNLSFFHRFSAASSLPEQNHLGWGLLLVPVAGALLIGLMARYGSEKIRGHGIPEALEAILLGRSLINPKVAILKPLSSAISIGTGGPFGAEGPIIMTGGAFGSLFAQFFDLSSAERKTLLVAGAASGMSAVFATPIAAVLLAVELLLFEWKPRSFVPVAVASIIASVMRVPLLGAGPMFPVASHAVPGVNGLLAALFIGLAAGFGSWLLTTIVYAAEDGFQKLPIHWMWWPAIGALVVGLGGMIEPRILGTGYDTIHALMLGQIVGGLLVGLLITKAIVWAVALGSGTSGGILAPLLIIGGSLGALLGHYLPVGDAGLWAMVSMGAIMGGTMRSPFTGMIFILELTHVWDALPALFIASMVALGVTVLVLRRSILTEKLARRGQHIAREYSVDVFELIRVGDVMDQQIPTVNTKMTVGELSGRLAKGDSVLSRRQGILIVDADNKLMGIITRGDLMHALVNASAGDISVLEAGKTDLVVAYPDELLHDAIVRMFQYDIGRLPVVKRDAPDQAVGYLGRGDILGARMRLHEEEEARSKGPLAKGKDGQGFWPIPFFQP